MRPNSSRIAAGDCASTSANTDSLEYEAILLRFVLEGIFHRGQDESFNLVTLRLLGGPQTAVQGGCQR